MLQINVVLPNGHAEALSLLPSSTVRGLRTEAQQALRKKYLRLITAKNRVLVDFEQTLEEAEIEDGECLTALVLQPQLAATQSAFALWCHGDSAVVTWGNYGGDCSEVRDQLKGVQQIEATHYAFAAILEDGSVVTWGHAQHGGDSSAVRDHAAQGCAADSSGLISERPNRRGRQSADMAEGAEAFKLKALNAMTLKPEGFAVRLRSQSPRRGRRPEGQPHYMLRDSVEDAKFAGKPPLLLQQWMMQTACGGFDIPDLTVG